MKTALIAGASGLIGGHCLRQLLAADHYESVTALVRQPLEMQNTKLRQLEVNFDHLADIASDLGADDVYCCLGTTLQRAGSRDAFRRVDHDYPVNLARLARLRGADGFFLVSSVGAAPDSRFFYLQVKGETERDIARLGFANTRFFRPSLLLGERREARRGERLWAGVMRMAEPLLVGRWRNFRPIEAKTVARAMVVASTRGPGLFVHPTAEIRALAAD